MGEAAKQTTRHKEYSLLVAAATALMLFFAGSVHSVPLLFCINAVAIASILYSAFSVVRHADVLAHRYGEPYGSLILSLSIVVLEVSLISILMLSGAAGKTLMRDTIYAVIITVMGGFIGFALLFGGRRYKSQYFNLSGVKHFLISIIPLSLAVLALPTALGGSTLTRFQMLIVSAACLFLYITFLRIQTVSHRYFFVYEDEDEEEDGHHTKPSPYGSARHFAFLLVHLVAVIGVTKMDSVPLERLFGALNAPAAFSGFVVALLILSPEGAGAFRSILRNRVQQAMNLLLGSVIATISLTVPVVVCVALATGQELAMGLGAPDILLLVATFLICQISLTSGRTNAHSGAAHIVIFMLYLMLMFS